MALEQHHIALLILGFSSLFTFITLILTGRLIAILNEYYFGYYYAELRIANLARALLVFLIVNLLLNFGHFFTLLRRLKNISAPPPITKKIFLTAIVLIALSGICSIVILGISGTLASAIDSDSGALFKAPGGMGIVSALLGLCAAGVVAWFTMTTKNDKANENVEGGRAGLKNSKGAIHQLQPQLLTMPILATSSPQPAMMQQNAVMPQAVMVPQAAIVPQAAMMTQPMSAEPMVERDSPVYNNTSHPQQPVVVAPPPATSTSHSWSVYKG